MRLWQVREVIVLDRMNPASFVSSLVLPEKEVAFRKFSAELNDATSAKVRPALRRRTIHAGLSGSPLHCTPSGIDSMPVPCARVVYTDPVFVENSTQTAVSVSVELAVCSSTRGCHTFCASVIVPTDCTAEPVYVHESHTFCRPMYSVAPSWEVVRNR